MKHRRHHKHATKKIRATLHKVKEDAKKILRALRGK